MMRLRAAMVLSSSSLGFSCLVDQESKFTQAAHTENFKEKTKAAWQAINARVQRETSPATQQYMNAERKKTFFRYFGHVQPLGSSSLDRYTFGREIPLEEKYRHKIFAYALMAILDNEFNGNKCGLVGSYPQRNKQCSHELVDAKTDKKTGLYLSPSTGTGVDYLGHNIAALAVNEFGRIVTSAFNHNKIFGTTADHAEMRLIDQCFRSPGLHFSRSEVELEEKEKLEVEDKMELLSVYTSLEPCQQCSGKMLLAGVPLVVYCQRDPDIMLEALRTYNINFKTRPLPAVLLGFPAYDELDDKYFHLRRNPPSENFWIPPEEWGVAGKRFKSSMPYFLCTDDAKDIFVTAREKFDCLMTDADPEFARLSELDRASVLAYKPPANLALTHNLENEIWARRRELLSFEHHQRKEIRLAGLSKACMEGQLAEQLAVVEDVGNVEGINIARFAGSGQSMGVAYITFSTPNAAEKAGLALEKNGWEVSPATNSIGKNSKLVKLLSKLSAAERKLEEESNDDKGNSQVLSNAEALQQARQYVVYEQKCERRGTMHR